MQYLSPQNPPHQIPNPSQPLQPSPHLSQFSSSTLPQSKLTANTKKAAKNSHSKRMSHCVTTRASFSHHNSYSTLKWCLKLHFYLEWTGKRGLSNSQKSLQSGKLTMPGTPERTAPHWDINFEHLGHSASWGCPQHRRGHPQDNTNTPTILFGKDFQKQNSGFYRIPREKWCCLAHPLESCAFCVVSHRCVCT